MCSRLLATLVVAVVGCSFGGARLHCGFLLCFVMDVEVTSVLVLSVVVVIAVVVVAVVVPDVVLTCVGLVVRMAVFAFFVILVVVVVAVGVAAHHVVVVVVAFAAVVVVVVLSVVAPSVVVETVDVVPAVAATFGSGCCRCNRGHRGVNCGRGGG